MADQSPPRRRRERKLWREGIEELADRIGVHPEPWQLEVAAHLLSLRPVWQVTARAQIWSETQNCASEVAAEMQADGRINEWGNWPEEERERSHVD